MKLTKEEARKIDQGLAVLKKKLAGQIKEQMGDKRGEVDNAFVNKAAKAYMTVEGFAQILQDSGMVTGKGRDCGCAGPCYTTCASPCKNSMTGVGG